MGLQHFQFRFFQIFLLADFGIQQFPNTADHNIEANAQLGNFIHIVRGHQRLQIFPGNGCGHIV